jgi:membrane protein
MIVKKFVELLKTSFSQWNSRDAPRMGAALAFYSVLSLAPLVLLVIGVCALAFGTASAQAQLLEQFRGMVGDEGARAIDTVLSSAQKPASGAFAGLAGIITLLFGASGVFVELRAAMNRLWEVRGPTAGSSLWWFIRDRFLSIGMVLAIGFMLLVSLAASAALAAAGTFFSSLGFLPPGVWEIVNVLFSLGVVTGLFALILRYVPDARLPWRAVSRGAALTAILFTLGKTLIGLYLGKAGVGSAYGAAGSLVVLVVWIYYSAQIFFFGAMFTRVYAGSHGWKPEAPQVPKTQTLNPTHKTGGVRQPLRSSSSLARLAAAGLILRLLFRRRRQAS